MTASLQQCHINWLNLFWSANSIENNVCSAAEHILKSNRGLVAYPYFMWENIPSLHLVFQMDVCWWCASLPPAKRLRWPLLVLPVRFFQFKLISTWYGLRKNMNQRKKINNIIFYWKTIVKYSKVIGIVTLLFLYLKN